MDQEGRRIRPSNTAYPGCSGCPTWPNSLVRLSRPGWRIDAIFDVERVVILCRLTRDLLLFADPATSPFFELALALANRCC